MAARVHVGRRAKYGNRKVVVDGRTFDSQREANRYGELSLMARAGLIDSLECQVPYRCVVNGRLVCTYVADFVYRDPASGAVVVEDAKGYRTREYRLKKKLVEAMFGITIVEV